MSLDEEPDNIPPSETLEDLGDGLEIVEYELGGMTNDPQLALRDRIIEFLNVYGERNPSIQEDKELIRKAKRCSWASVRRLVHINGLNISHVQMYGFDAVYVCVGEEEYYCSYHDGNKERVKTYRRGEWEQLFRQSWFPFTPQDDMFVKGKRILRLRGVLPF